MEVRVENSEPCVRTVSVTVPVERVGEAFEKAIQDLARKVQVPGFRKGKVPRSIIRARFQGDLREDVAQQLIKQTLFNALQENDIELVATPEVVESSEIVEDKDFSYTARVEIKPEIELKKYTGLEMEDHTPNVSDEAINAELESMRQGAAQLVPVLERTTVAAGDTVILDYAGSMGGVPIEGGQAENATIEAGGDGVIKDLSEGLIGCQVPGERDIPVTFPEDYPAEHLAGKPATFRVSLKEMKKREVPALDDDFAQDQGEDSLSALKEKVSATLAERGKDEAEGKSRKSLLQSLIDANPFDVPPSMVQEQARRMVASAAARIESMFGQKLSLSPEDMQNLSQESLKDAEFQVRSGLLLLEVGKDANLEVSDDEVGAEIDRMAEEAGEQAAFVKNYYQRAEVQDQLKYRLLESKTIAFLKEAAEKVPPKEQDAEAAAETADNA